MDIFDNIEKPTEATWETVVQSPLPISPYVYGSQRKDAPESARDDIRALSATGFSKRGIAAHFGVNEATLNRWLDDDDSLSEAFAVGRDQERFALHNVLYRKAMNGDGPAAMFLLKARHGYREGDQSDQANRVAITFNLPGAAKAEDYGKVAIDGTDSAKRIPNETA
jgi:hypothetical protein